jgi:hypothetical protein
LFLGRASYDEYVGFAATRMQSTTTLPTNLNAERKRHETAAYFFLGYCLCDADSCADLLFRAWSTYLDSGAILAAKHR